MIFSKEVEGQCSIVGEKGDAGEQDENQGEIKGIERKLIKTGSCELLKGEYEGRRLCDLRIDIQVALG
jgi:hypothetical protein